MNGCKAFCEFSEWYCRFKGNLNNLDAVKENPLGSDIPASLAHFSHPSQSTESSRLMNLTGIRATPASASPTFSKLEKEFVKQLSQLIDLLQLFGTTEAACLGNLCNMMDFNLYYSTQVAPEVAFMSSPAMPQKVRNFMPVASQLSATD